MLGWGVRLLRGVNSTNPRGHLSTEARFSQRARGLLAIQTVAPALEPNVGLPVTLVLRLPSSQWSTMTRQHIYFIPVVFLLGVIVGHISSLRGSRPAPLTRARATLATVLWPLAGFVVLFLATHAFSVHGGAKAVHHALGDLPLFDQRPSFGAEEVYRRIQLFSPEGRVAYQRMTYTTDVAFPVTLWLFLVQLARYVAERTTAAPLGLRRLAVLLPGAWLGTDLLENWIVYDLLATFPNRRDGLAAALGYVTETKFALLVGSLLATATLTWIGASSATARKGA